MRSVGLQRACEKAEKLANETTQDFDHSKYDLCPRYENYAHVVCDDGSTFTVRNAFIEKWTDEDGEEWVAVIAEHYDTMVFAVGDLVFWSEMMSRDEMVKK